MKPKTIINGHEIAGRTLFQHWGRVAIRARLKMMTRRVMKPQPKLRWPRVPLIDYNHEASEGSYFNLFYQGPGLYETSPSGSNVLFHKHLRCPYGKPGDVLAMTEPLRRLRAAFTLYADDEAVVSKASTRIVRNGIHFAGTPLKWRWKRDVLTSIHMPYEAARTFLQITDIRAERVQDISAKDCIAEGVTIPVSSAGNPLLELTGAYPPVDYITEQLSTAFAFGAYKPEMEPDLLRAYFASLWDSINAKPKPSKRNPYTGEPEKCFVSYPWEDIREVRKRKGLNWYVIGNPWNWAITWRLI